MPIRPGNCASQRLARPACGMPTLASSTSTRSSISASTVSSPGSPVGSASPAPAALSRASAAGIERAGQQAELERVERVERAAPALHRLAAALARLVDALQREQRVDPADVADAGRRPPRCAPALPASRLNVPDAERRAARLSRRRAGPLVPWMRMRPCPRRLTSRRAWLTAALTARQKLPRAARIDPAARPPRSCQIRKISIISMLDAITPSGTALAWLSPLPPARWETREAWATGSRS